MADRERLRLAMVIPPFRRGSGGHNTLFQIFSRLERRGHVCSVWLYDYYGQHTPSGRPCCARKSASSSRRSRGPSTRASMTGRAPTWRSRPAGRPCTRRSSSTCRARAYVVNDHEPDFYAGLRRARAGRGNLPSRHALHRGQPVAARPADRALRHERRGLPARRRPRDLPAPPRRAPRDTSSTTPVMSRRAARCRSA